MLGPAYTVHKYTDFVELEAALLTDLDGWKTGPSTDARDNFEALTRQLISFRPGSKKLLLYEKSIASSQELATKICTIARAADTQLLAKAPTRYSNNFLRIVERAAEVECSLDNLILSGRQGDVVLQNAYAARTLHWQTLY